jgi:hypothetical protein
VEMLNPSSSCAGPSKQVKHHVAEVVQVTCATTLPVRCRASVKALGGCVSSVSRERELIVVC